MSPRRTRLCSPVRAEGAWSIRVALGRAIMSLMASTPGDDPRDRLDAAALLHEERSALILRVIG